MSFDENKYLIFAKTEKNKKIMEKYEELWDFIKEAIRLFEGTKPVEFSKNCMMIKFNSSTKVPINKILNISACVIIIAFTSKRDDKYYPQIYLDSCYLKENIVDF